MKLKILSWNIWFDCDFKKVKEFLAAAEADIFCLEEVVPDDPTRDTVAFMTALGYQHVLAPVLKLRKDGRTMSNAMFTKLPILGSEIGVLSDTESRNALRVDLDLGGAALHVVTTHIFHAHQKSSEVQAVQIDNLLHFLPETRTVVAGDFNMLPNDPSLLKMGERLVNANPASTPTLDARTFDCSGCDPSPIRNTCLDYIFTTADIKNSNFRVHQEATGSDHLPIAAEIELDNP